MEEIWIDIPGYEGKYQASNLGNIKSLKYRGHSGENLLAQQINPITGYMQTHLSKEGKVKNYRTNVLVAMAFLGHIPCKQEIVVRHKNNIKTDNRLENLILGTSRDNSHDYHKNRPREYPIGVRIMEGRKNPYISQISINGKLIYLGAFQTPEEAFQAYQTALKEHNSRKDI